MTLDSAVADFGDDSDGKLVSREFVVSGPEAATEGVVSAYFLDEDRRPHYYSDKAYICNEDEDPGCTPDVVFHALRQFAAPGRESGVPVNDGDTTTVPLLGTVVHEVDESNLSVRNETLEDHILHPGYVERSVQVKNGDIYVISEGQGTGNFASLNEDLSGVLWGFFNARRIREALMEP